MGADKDLLFGKIAVDRKYCSPAQLEKCISLQAHDPDRVPLGQILLREGFITPDQHGEILAIQRQNLNAIDPVRRVSKESILIGRLAVQAKLMTEADVNTCLRIQALDGEKRSIGEIMVARKHLTADELKKLLALQLKRIMSCPACRLSFTVLSSTQTKLVRCPRCKGLLKEGKPTDSVRTDADLETSVSNRLRKESVGAAPPVPPAASIRMVRMICPMCSKPFHEPVDSKGRVDCPHCLSTFSA